jgi:integration host factor subunit alpha
MSLTKKDLANELVTKMGMTPNTALDIVNSFFESIKTTLISGEDVKLSGFGNFVLNEKKARPGRNPKTGEEHIISARRVVTFRAGTKLKATVNT